MMVFCLMTRRKINLVRLILDFILVVVNVNRRRHVSLPYCMFLTRVSIRAQLPLDRHKADNKRPTTTMKAFSILGLKPQAQEKEKEKESKKKKDVVVVPSTKKTKSKPFEEDKKKKKMREKSPSPIPRERRASKRRLMRLTEEFSSSLKAKIRFLQLL